MTRYIAERLLIIPLVNMFKKENRLRKKNDFDRVFKEGKSSYDKILGIKVLFNEQEENRYGVIVSTKISKKAVKRNRIKRQIREAVKALAPDLKKSLDLVVIALPGASDKDYWELKTSLENHLQKLKLL